MNEQMFDLVMEILNKKVERYTAKAEGVKTAASSREAGMAAGFAIAIDLLKQANKGNEAGLQWMNH